MMRCPDVSSSMLTMAGAVFLGDIGNGCEVVPSNANLGGNKGHSRLAQHTNTDKQRTIENPVTVDEHTDDLTIAAGYSVNDPVRAGLLRLNREVSPYLRNRNMLENKAPSMDPISIGTTIV